MGHIHHRRARTISSLAAAVVVAGTLVVVSPAPAPAADLYVPLGAIDPAAGVQQGFAVADLNGDGVPDLVSGGQLRAALGRGDGTFAPAVGLSDSISIYPAVGDFDGDGVPDVVGLSGAPQRSGIVVGLGNGDGTFRTTNQTTTPFGLGEIAVGDLDRDGRLDLVSVNFTNNAIVVLRGRGDGTFLPATTVSVPDAEREVELADVDEDGDLDMLVALLPTTGFLGVALGDGAGRFGPVTQVPSGFQLRYVETGDLNGDGHVDVVGSGSGGGLVAVMLGRGDGTFDISSVPVPTSAGAITVADVVGDWRPDVILESQGGAVRFEVLENDGSGGLLPPVTVGSGPEGGILSQVEAHDLDLDGRRDVVLIAGAATNSPRVQVVMSRGPGFRAASSVAVGGGPFDVDLADVAGSTAQDVVVAGSVGNNVPVLTGNGSGGFSPTTTIANNAEGTEAVVVGRFNADALPDVASVRGGGSVGVALNNGGGTFAAPVTLAGPATFTRFLTSGLVDGDPHLDLVALNTGADTVSVYRGNGLGGFAPLVSSPTGDGPRGGVLASVNGDPHLDLVTANDAGGTVSVLLGVGNGSFTPGPVLTIGVGSGPRRVDAGDLDGDGDTDLVVTAFSINAVVVYLGAGDGTFTEARRLTVPGAFGVTLSDVTRDGVLDLLTTTNTNNTVQIGIGTGTGDFGVTLGMPTGAGSLDVEVGRLDADTRPDIVTANRDDNTLSVLLAEERPIVTTDRTALAFGRQAAGTSVPRQSVTLANGGSAPVGYTATVTGPDAEAFEVAETCGGGLLPEVGVCRLRVRFVPKGDGYRTATLRVTATTGLVQDLPLTAYADATAPSVSITGGPADGATTNVAAASFTLATDDGFARFRCSVDGAPATACTSPFTTAALVDGRHTVRVSAVDDAGNASDPVQRGFTVDTVGPTVTIGAGPAAGATTRDRDPAFGFSSSEPGSTFTCRVGSAAPVACTSPFSGAQLEDGTYTFEVRATDAAGNEGEVVSRTFTVDATGPVVSLTSGPAAGSFTSQRRPAFGLGSTEAGTFECRIDGAPFAACTTPYAPGADLADGVHVLLVRAIDVAGNLGDPLDRVFTVDATPPTVAVVSGPAPLTRARVSTFTFTASEPATFECRIDTGAFAPCTSPFRTPSLLDGTHTVAIRAIDRAGNTEEPAVRTFRVDATRPGLTVVAPAKVKVTRGRAVVKLVLRVTEEARLTCQVDGGRPRACRSGTKVTLTPGKHVITVRATDPAGNVTTKVKRIRVT